MATRRPDLEALEVNPGFSYIGEKVLPVFPQAQKNGIFYSQDQPADVAAQTGRTLGVAPTEATEEAVPVEFLVAERIKRSKTPESEIKLFGGLDKSEIRMTKITKRSIMRSRENAVVAATVNGALPIANIADSLRAAVDVAIDDVHRFQGKLMIALGWTAYRRISRFQEIQDVLLRTSVFPMTAADIRNVTVGTMADILGVAEIIVGDDAHWPKDRLLVYKQPMQDVEPAEEAQLGRFLQYFPEDESPVQVDSYFWDDDITFKVQARVWDVIKVLNTPAAKILDGIDEGNVVVTSTTTTTT